MRSWIVGLLCIALAVYVAARYQDQAAADIDAEVENLEREVRALSEEEIADRKKREFDLDDLTDGEIEDLLNEIDNNKRSYNVGQPEKKFIRIRWRRAASTVRRGIDAVRSWARRVRLSGK